jgi:uncharacterized protein
MGCRKINGCFMKSCLYKVQVMHNRLEPKKHRFHYRYFMFYVNLDECEGELKKFFPFIGINRAGLFSLRDKDHIRYKNKDGNLIQGIKNNLLHYLDKEGIEIKKPVIFMLANFATLGYQFNPVSFFFVYDDKELKACVTEVTNTYREQKPFLLKPENLKDGIFEHRETKHFYVSPFLNHDLEFHFRLSEPGEQLNLSINDLRAGKTVFLSTLSGRAKPMTRLRILYYFLRFPLVTLQVIGLIHWNAFLLWIKKIRYFRKKDFPELQRHYYPKGENVI